MTFSYVVSESVQLSLALGNNTTQGRRIQGGVEMNETLFSDRIHLGVIKETLVGGAGLVVGFLDVASGASFPFELHHGLEEVGEGIESPVEGGEDSELFFGVETSISDGATDDGVVFLFDEVPLCGIVLAVGTASGKGDAMLAAVGQELLVDELSPAVGVNPPKREREGAADILEGFQDPSAERSARTSIPSWPLEPSRWRFGHDQSVSG